MDLNRLIWLNGSIIPLKDAKLNVLSPSFQFGANVFEGIRAYWNEEKKQLFAFRLDDHYSRLINSIKLFKMNSNYNLDDLKNALLDVTRANSFKEDIAIRQTVFVDGFGNWASQDPIGMFVSPIPFGRYLPSGKIGLSACISTFERINDNSMSPRIKVGANYINSRYAQLEAKNNGYDTCIFLNNLGKVSEGPGSCIFVLKKNILFTPMLTDSILDSITRNTVIRIARELLKIQVIERSIDRTELYLADGIFLCGSAMEIVPILKVDSFGINNLMVHQILKNIMSKYLEITKANFILDKSWITPIY
jgi:branched-chain amino acid aminotransferase